MSSKANKLRYEQWLQEQIAKAESFTACMFIGAGKYDRRPAATLDEARELRTTMLAEYGNTNGGRGVAIYAILDSQTIHVE